MKTMAITSEHPLLLVPVAKLSSAGGEAASLELARRSPCFSTGDIQGCGDTSSLEVGR